MGIAISAAVVREWGGTFEIEELTLGDPRPEEVLVRTSAVGICRTDIHLRDGEYQTPKPPFVAGHEGVGVVEAVGAAVTAVSPGDRVVLSFPSCGACDLCLRGAPAYCRHGFDMSFGGHRLDGSRALTDAHDRQVNGHVFQQSSFATHVLAHLRTVVPLPESTRELDPAVLAPLGCGFATGAGAVLNTIRPRPGAAIVVVGAGTVGLAAVMAARAVHAGDVIVIDRNAARLQLARELGATATLAAGSFQEGVLDLLPHGAAAVIETTAVPENVATSVEVLDAEGVVALLGGAPLGTTAPIDLTTLLNGRTIRGVIQGDAVPQDFLPRLLQLHAKGAFPVDRLISRYEFCDIRTAVDDMEAGTVVKPVLVMPH